MATFPNQPGSTHSSVLEGIRDPGNRSAWERFHAQYAPYVLALAKRNGLRHADAEDLVQTVFAELAVRIRTFDYDRSRGRFHNWLAEAARFRIQDMQRRNARREARELADPEPDAQAPDDFGAMVEEEWRNHVQRVALERLRERSSRRRFELFHASVIEGWPTAETMKAYGATRAAVYQAKYILAPLWRGILQEVQAELDPPPPPPAAGPG
ncbi:MAG: sigma-70 family RNA polymerase sigma factor [Kiritimatiellae bacterium]|nr:sigma-70 family RNA polymerase sigma factor [Kiritimatiellia bacterium]